MSSAVPSRRLGVLLCGLSAIAFALLGPFGIPAFATGASVNTVIGWRFLLAAAVVWVVVAVSRRPLGRGRALWQPLLMGAVLYATQSGLYFLALQRLTVGLTSLLLYTMPVMVVLVSLATGRERANVRVLAALTLAVGGVGLTLLGPGVGAVSGLGVLFGLGSAVVYTVYFFGMDTLPDRTDRVSATALICTGAAAAHIVVGNLRGVFDWRPPGDLMIWVVAMAGVSTVLAMMLLLTGIRGAGASRASVVSCLEPITAVTLGASLFADPFGPVQWLGTAGVVAAVVLLALRSGPSAAVVAEPESMVVR
ncbi:EamA family transporter [Microlunatus aurantiacus]|uniref:EamA family transporter n=1 Tax=Microlunatus aurantiacus TaxID=446786 RepID=A0ABP7CY76_9ACTN